MDAYVPLLEKTRVPQPSLQKFAVISIFSKLRSAPSHLGPESEPGREAIFQCLHSASPAVVDQSVREFCRLVNDSELDVSLGLLELQSALEGCDKKFVSLFVKALGFVVRVGFQKHNGSWNFGTTENHPFVKILSSRPETHSELLQQVLLFITQNKQLGMVKACEFLRPFFNFSILRVPFLDSLSSSCLSQLVSSVASLCCSFPNDAMPVFELLIGCLKYFPHKNIDHRDFNYIVECTVDAYLVVLRQLVAKGLLVTKAQICGIELVETILSHYASPHGNSCSMEFIAELLKHMLAVQKDLCLQYKPELSSVILSLFAVLVKSELEHEQLCILKLLVFLVQWKSENECGFDGTVNLGEEILLIFPTINLMSSPSKSVKSVATGLLIMLEKPLQKLLASPKIELATKENYRSSSGPEYAVVRLLKHLRSQDHNLSTGFSFLSLTSVDNESKSWTAQLREYLLLLIDRRKSSPSISAFFDAFSTELSLLFCAIANVLVMNPSTGSSAIDAFAAIGMVDAKLGVSLLLAVLFYINLFTKKDVMDQNMLLKLLGMLPSLATQSAMIPLVVQTILPMLNKNAKPVLYASATRLLCQTWEINDRAFGNLQGVLQPKGFTDSVFARDIHISMAASVRDVCRRNPDRGVDLILSVSACIESEDHVIKALGLESLAHLCEADVIDFYTAWEVIAKHVLDYSSDPILAYSITLLLKWGAMDAKAYPEASKTVMNILWDLGVNIHFGHELQWAKTRASAFEALSQYEVAEIDKSIPYFKKRSVEILCSETNQDVLKAIEGFQVKIITHEHNNRRRFVKEKKVPGTKIEKLLDVFPRVIFSSGKKSNAGELPGAALLCHSFMPKDFKSQGASGGSSDVHSAYGSALVDTAATLQLSRNIFVALLSLQSWKYFMRRWIRAEIQAIDAKATFVVLDKTSKAASDILKFMMRVTEESMPRSAENIALAIGALCAVLPPSAHTIKSTASKFLLSWLFQHEHEHRQWSAAISLGLISSSLHVTDHRQKHESISGLLEVLCGSQSILVRGACAVGLGFSCQGLLIWVEDSDKSKSETETNKMKEMILLGKTVKVLSQMISQLAPSDILNSLSAKFPVDTSEVDINSEWLYENSDDLEDDIWGVAGLVLGLANSVGVMYRAGAHDSVLRTKCLLVSWIPHVNSLVNSCGTGGQRSEMLLSVGSCLALPIVVGFCRRVELMSDEEMDHLLSGFRELVSELLSDNKSGNLSKSLLMASCVGAGSLLACTVSEGLLSFKVDHVNCLLKLFKKCYSNPNPSIVHLGGMLGVVNALGASAGYLIDVHSMTSTMRAGSAQKEQSYILGPLLSNPACEQSVTSLMQEMFLVAQSCEDYQLQQYAAWAVSFLRSQLWSRELVNDDNKIQTNISDAQPVSQGFPKDNTVAKLGVWLTNLNYSGAGQVVPVTTVSAVLRCLSRAPRLPSLEWGVIIRQCMRYEAQVAKSSPPDLISYKNGTLREECIQFSLAHAKQFDQLLTLLDELSDLSRLRTLELNLQSFLLLHLADLVKLYSGSRLEKLFDDAANYLSLVTIDQDYDANQKSLLRISCWKGLYQCLEDASIDSLEYFPNMEKCMEVMFTLLPESQSAGASELNQKDTIDEWSEAVKCLGKARREWVLDILQVSHVDPIQRDVRSRQEIKKIQAKAKLVRIGSMPLAELGKLKAYILNFESLGIWDVLVEVVAALQLADGSVKRQWLVDAVEISCVSLYPSTALLFLGLLAGSCCRYMPLLMLNRSTILNDLSLTLPSLLSEPSWEIVAESVTSYLLTSTERVCNWATDLAAGQLPSMTQPIDESQNEEAMFLFHVMHNACLSMKDYLPLEKQLKLSNMIVVT